MTAERGTGARLLAFAFAVFVLLAGEVRPASAQGGPVVREIHVEGVQRIEPETVRSYLNIQRGDPFDAARIDGSLKNLFATGLFADVTIRRQDDDLIVAVVENPIINRIAFEGNDKIPDETLEAEVTLRPRVIFTRTKVQNDVRRLLTLYRRSGRFAAAIEPKVIRLPQNRIDLVFEINEGPPTEIQRIRFVGNREFSDSKLRDVIRTKESRWYRFLTSDDTYDPDRLTLDRELMRQFYLSKGFADFRVVSAVAELTPDRKDFFITFTVEEGPRYKFGNVEVEMQLRGMTAADVKDALEIKRGEWYNAKALETTVDAITNKVSSLGQSFVDVRPRIDRNRQDRVINVAFEVAEGPRVFVERIDIVGNVRTLDRVIRREFRLAEGDAFNVSKLRRSKQRIQNLDYFQKVEVEQTPGSAPDKTVIKTQVEEKSTGSISFGVGYSTSNGALTDVVLRERNLLGRGQDLKLGGRLAQRGTQVDLSFTEPRFLDRELSAGADAFRITRDLTNVAHHKLETTGGAVRIGYPITERLNQGWRYTLKEVDITDVETGASRFVRDAAGATITSEVGHTLVYDRLDNTTEPTSGYILRMNNDVAGLGGDSKYVRNRLTGAKYFPLADDWVLMTRATGGYIVGLGEDVRIRDRFYVGGDDVRGFATGGVGPRDITTNDALGGEWMYAGTVELSFPLGLPQEFNFKGRLFTDVGSSGKLAATGPEVRDSSSPRVSIGTGVAWASPVGPLGLDLGFPILKESFDDTEFFRINFGTRF